MEFSPIPGYDDYFINRNGVVLSKKFGKERILNPGVSSGHGYYTVGLLKNKKQKTHTVHRLVGLTFIPNPNNYPCIDHIDRNKLNNCVDNLRWCNHQMNMSNQSKKKTNTSGLKNISFHKTSQKYKVYIQRNGKFISRKYFDTIEEAILHRNAVLDDLDERYDNID